MADKKRIALLGSTGSIGKQVLEVAEQLPDLLQVEVLAAYSNASLLIEQAIKFKPNVAVIVKDDLYEQVKEALWNYDIKVFAGEQALNDVVEMDCVDMVVSAIVGIAGLKPIYKAIEARKQIALANKETLVVAGDLMTQTAYENGVNIYPIDSEHSAIFQSLAGEFHNPIERIIITASGGPFRGKTADFLRTVTKAQALKHPNWSMGHKITIDSATLMNKGLEVIEAKWLFNTPLDKIEVVIHPQSIVHSLVEFQDGSIKAQLGLPDMKLPIQYALTYPYRCGNRLPRLHFSEHPHLTFEAPDLETFPCLNLAYRASRGGGCMPCVLNAANEMAVALFLHDKIGFYDIPRIIEDALTHADYSNPSSVDDYLAIDQDIKQTVLQSIK
ncbi:MAG: 1-deoxy-D-xylulose-5-phosphate reductoisomerase [Bacteroidales bacterium]|jgi:1-deoxy-D-xylulose-5-phosphate reductoisomerase|nr:1-deoxy-D-xylulose-5-phosphate reductoisomerase [Bacteroidales bacterium]MDD4394682.1 1-deoxy-D-xylulose-5-phosphate reductoisomerase [Bacteroidales bacterium]